MTEKVASLLWMAREGKTWLKSFLHRTKSEQHSRGFLSKESLLVGKNGAGRYPVFERVNFFDQLGWNRGSLHKLSSLAICKGRGLFYLFQDNPDI